MSNQNKVALILLYIGLDDPCTMQNENPKLQPDSPAQSDHLGFSFYMLWRSSGPIYSKIGGRVTGPWAY